MNGEAQRTYLLLVLLGLFDLSLYEFPTEQLLIQAIKTDSVNNVDWIDHIAK